ncbi:hypothetical protein [Streptomyces sp. NPDC059533]|uniref:hypothetical protein n=1 Tax=unclassified Streptomyces TaxID=2593676 RepID=UPI0036ABF008
MTDTREAGETRLRRLTEMRRIGAVTKASAALRDVWHGGREPSRAVFRTKGFLTPGSTEARPPLTRLVLPRGIAMRFYLLAVFEAHCQQDVGEPWMNRRPLSGVGSWSDFVAIDGAYDKKSGTYMRDDTKQGRNDGDLRLRQVKSALTTLKGLGTEQALVDIPQARNGSRHQYGQFTLMKETGRGAYQTPDAYTVPVNTWNVETFTVPSDFFLNGWVQVLTPSEVATWLILRYHSQWAVKQHPETGVYLYGNRREEGFGLRRDAWEDGCQRLREFGLIRHAHPGPLDEENPQLEELIEFFAQTDRERYEPYRWQVTDQGLTKDALETCMRELTIRQKRLNETAAYRAQMKNQTSKP